ncbi:hypothetical protein Tco_0546587 [Tanacetum coccineum]
MSEAAIHSPTSSVICTRILMIKKGEYELWSNEEDATEMIGAWEIDAEHVHLGKDGLGTARPRVPQGSHFPKFFYTRTPHSPQRPKKFMKIYLGKKEGPVGSQTVLHKMSIRRKISKNYDFNDSGLLVEINLFGCKGNKAEVVYGTEDWGFKSSKLLLEKMKKGFKDGDVNLEQRFPSHSKVSHMHAVKRIFRRSNSEGCQYLGKKTGRLVSWQCKKQTIVAISSTEAEYVAAASCCAQVLWMQNQLLDYGFNFMNTEIHIDNESTICIVKNPVLHSKTKHIQIRHHFIRDCYEQRLINVVKVHTDDNVADLLTKGFDLARFNFLVVTIGMMNP